MAYYMNLYSTASLSSPPISHTPKSLDSAPVH